MDRRRFLQTAAASGAVAWTAPTVVGAASAAAGTAQPCTDGRELFSDNFDQECDPAPSSGYCANYIGFQHWDVVDGGVDIVVGNRHGGCGPDESTGRSVDMAGTNLPHGTLTHKTGIPVVAGRSYLLTFSIGSNGNQADNELRAQFGSASQDFPAPAIAGCEPRSLVLVPGASGTAGLSFVELGNTDSLGSVLDNVVVREYCTPEGAGDALSAPG